LPDSDDVIAVPVVSKLTILAATISEKKQHQIEQSWETSLSHMALDLPTFDTVSAYLRVEMLRLIQ